MVSVTKESCSTLRASQFEVCVQPTGGCPGENQGIVLPAPCADVRRERPCAAIGDRHGTSIANATGDR